MLEGLYLGNLWTQTRQNELLRGRNPHLPNPAFVVDVIDSPMPNKRTGRRAPTK